MKDLFKFLQSPTSNMPRETFPRAALLLPSDARSQFWPQVPVLRQTSAGSVAIMTTVIVMVIVTVMVVVTVMDIVILTVLVKPRSLAR